MVLNRSIFAVDFLCFEVIIMEKIAKPKLDLVFKKLFGDVENVDLLTDFLSSVLDIPISDIIDVSIIDNEIVPDALDNKFSRLDLLLQTSRSYINIEIQVNNYGDYKERALYYWSKVYSKQLGKGQGYSELQPTISINIIDFNLFDDSQEPHSVFEIMERNRQTLFSDKLRIDFLELPKAKQYKNQSRLKNWLDFLNVTTEEGLEMLENNSEAIKKAVAVVKKMSADERLLYEIEKREERLLEERSALLNAERNGIAKGKETIIQKMRKSGMSEEQINAILSIN